MKKLCFSLAAILLLTAGCSSEEVAEPKDEQLKEEVKKEPEKKGKNTINVEIDVEPVVEEDGKVHFIGKTNLPDYAELMFTLKGLDGYTAQSKETVLDGVIETGSFSNKGEGLPGKRYQLSIELSSTQDDKFVDVVGKEYENLTGDLIIESVLGKTMEYRSSFLIEGKGKKNYISPDEVEKVVNYIAIGEQDKLISVDVVDGEIKIVIEQAPHDLLPGEDLATNTYSKISDELLELESWDILTIQYVDIGTISMNRSEKERNEYGDYFPTQVIEERLE
ncbi:hypothetical protein D5F11_016300 [Siminovitchia terrae]|uniref:GerMN domain-containing protein n=1 Tax=Siminovitchia terrae TaxID=1914933 RepID=A0A429X588_SIMTE|nr:hypothetical protein [Siminovitchia terrae]RST58595.1 hypothetical protein D5F11_016300 [Siminovitchia terrae]